MTGPSRRLAFVVALATAPTACTALFPLSGLSSGDTGDDGAPAKEGAAGEASSGGPAGDGPANEGADAAPLGDALAETHPESGGGESGTVTYAQTVLADNPLAYWRLDEPAGSMMAQDSSGHGMTGTYMGTVTHAVPGAIANDPDTAAGFDGATAFVDVGAVFAFAGTVQCSLEAWAQPVLNSSYQNILSRNDSSNGPIAGYLLYVEPAPQSIFDYERVQSSTGKVFAQSTAVAATGAWAHVVATFDGTTMVLYVNGNVEGTQANTVSLPTANSDFVLAAAHGGQDTWWHGALDEVAVYDHALSTARVVEHYKVGTGQGP
jgi:hypothetical protein